MAKETGTSAAAIKRRPEYRAKKTAGFLYSFFRGLLLIGLSYIVLYPIIFKCQLNAVHGRICEHHIINDYRQDHDIKDPVFTEILF